MSIEIKDNDMPIVAAEKIISGTHLKRWILSRVFKTQLSVSDVIDQIDRELTIEPERKQGKWIWQIFSKYMCSECGQMTTVDECMEEPMYIYCPYCGAKMNGGEEE